MITRRRTAARSIATIFAAMALLITLGGPAAAKPKPAGYLTAEDPFITLAPALPSGASVTAIISSGESLNDFQFQGLPDGIGVRPGEAKHTVDVYVAHEETTVPFFGTADFQNASVSKLTLSTKGGHGQGGILGASVALSPDDGFRRSARPRWPDPPKGSTTTCSSPARRPTTRACRAESASLRSRTCSPATAHGKEATQSP